jgi:hypothetical protein
MTEENKITAICQECDEQFDYILKKGFPRKYCYKCSAEKKAAYESEHAPKQPEAPVQIVKPGVTPQSKGNAHSAMYVSYAKDIFVALINKYETVNAMGISTPIMEEAIDLVKQAKEAFE